MSFESELTDIPTVVTSCLMALVATRAAAVTATHGGVHTASVTTDSNSACVAMVPVVIATKTTVL